MSEPIDDGGPAFPNNDAHGCAFAGMTLRDYFAAKAMAAIIANPECVKNPVQIAGHAFDYADAMLEEREVKP